MVDMHTQVMGIVNVTPDSFSDGGRFEHVDAAIAHGLRLAADGAAIVDVGGESTRPGAQPVDPEEECARVLPVIRALAAEAVIVSVDTRHALTAERAMAAGASIINDITGFVEPDLVRVAAATGARVVISHSPTDDPRTMQAHAHYDDVVAEVRDFLARRIDECHVAGITDIVIDPGIGFGKHTQHNLALIAALDHLADLRRPVLVGVSRKRFIGELSGNAPPDRRIGGTIAAGLSAVAHGASILRVHDVFEHVQALQVWHAIAAAAED
ncbi:MAG: hypothetical protein RJA49_571 [Actinomycetota bacterium]